MDQTQAQILNSETIIRIEKGERISTQKLLIQINDKKDNWLSNIEIAHDPDEEFDLLEARIIDRNGNTVRNIKKKDIVTRSDRSNISYYQDGLIEEFDMYWNQYPYQVEYSYEITTPEFFWVATWYPVKFTTITSVKSSLKVEIPVGYEVSMDFSDDLTFDESIEEDYKVLRWSIDSYKTPKTEVYAPPMMETIPHVFITPNQFQYGVSGSSTSWSALGKWQMDLNMGTDELPFAERRVVKELISELDDPVDKTRILYNYLQDKTQYINVNIDKGGMKSYSASYVSRNKYGDCKALTTYMKALLKSAGIESYYTLIQGASNPIVINTEFPSQQFNHAVLMVPLEGQTIWLENTSNSAPFNYLGTFTHNRTALVVDAENSRLVKTPTLQAEHVADIRNYNFKAGEDDLWSFSLSADLGGPEFQNYRHYLKSVSTKDLEELVIKDFGGKGFELENLNFEQLDRNEVHLAFSAQGVCPQQIREIGSLKVVSPHRISIPKFEKPQRRKLGVRINFPINRVNVSSYEMSNSRLEKVEVPENIEVSSQYGSYKVTYQVNDQSLSIRESFMLEPGELPVSEYKDFYSFIHKIKSLQKTVNILIQ